MPNLKILGVSHSPLFLEMAKIWPFYGQNMVLTWSFILEKSFENILNKWGKNRSPDWSIEDCEKVLNSLKREQNHDMRGYVNELFYNQNIGTDLIESLLTIFNKIKASVLIPDSLNEAFFKDIQKKHKLALNLNIERCI